MRKITKRALAVLLAVCLLIPSLAVGGITLLADAADPCIPVRFDGNALKDTWRQTVGANSYQSLSEVLANPTAAVQIGQGISELTNGGTSIQLGYAGNAYDYTFVVASVPNVDLSKTPYLYLEDANFTSGIYYELYVGWEGATPFGASDSYKTLMGIHYHVDSSQIETHKFDLRTQLTDYEAKKGATLWITVKMAITVPTKATFDFDYMFLGVENAIMPKKVITDSFTAVRFDDKALKSYWKQTVGINSYKPLSDVRKDPAAALQIGRSIKELSNGGTSIHLGYKGNAYDYTFAVTSIPNVDLSKMPYLYWEDANFTSGLYYELYAGWEGATPFGASDQYKTLLGTHYHANPSQSEAHKIDLRTQLTDYESKKGETLWITVKLCITENTKATVDFSYMFLDKADAAIPTVVESVIDPADNTVVAFAARMDETAMANNWKQTVGVNTYKPFNQVAADPIAALVIDTNVEELTNQGTSIKLGYKGNANDYTYAVLTIPDVDLSKTPFLYWKDSNFTSDIYYELYAGWEGATPFGASDQYKTLLGTHYHGGGVTAEMHSVDLRNVLTDYQSKKSATLWVTIKLAITANTSASFRFDYLYLGGAKAPAPSVKNVEFPVREKPADPNKGYVAALDDFGQKNEWAMGIDGNWVPFDQLPKNGHLKVLDVQAERNGGTDLAFDVSGPEWYLAPVRQLVNVDIAKHPFLYLKEGPYRGGYFLNMTIVPLSDCESSANWQRTDGTWNLAQYHYNQSTFCLDLRTALGDQYDENAGEQQYCLIFGLAVNDGETLPGQKQFRFDYCYIGNEDAIPAFTPVKVPDNPDNHSDPEKGIGWAVSMDDNCMKYGWYYENADESLTPFAELPKNCPVEPTCGDDNKYGGTVIDIDFSGKQYDEAHVIYYMQVDLDETPYLYYMDGPFAGSYYMNMDIGSSTGVKNAFMYHYHESTTSKERHSLDLRTLIYGYKKGQGKQPIWIRIGFALTEDKEWANYHFDYMFVGNSDADPAYESDPVDPDAPLVDSDITLLDLKTELTAFGKMSAGTVLKVEMLDDAETVEYVNYYLKDRLKDMRIYEIGLTLFGGDATPDEPVVYSVPAEGNLFAYGAYFISDEGDVVRLDAFPSSETELSFAYNKTGLFVVGVSLLDDDYINTSPFDNPDDDHDDDSKHTSSPDTGVAFPLAFVVVLGISAALTAAVFKKKGIQ